MTYTGAFIRPTSSSRTESVPSETSSGIPQTMGHRSLISKTLILWNHRWLSPNSAPWWTGIGAREPAISTPILTIPIRSGDRLEIRNILIGRELRDHRRLIWIWIIGNRLMSSEKKTSTSKAVWKSWNGNERNSASKIGTTKSKLRPTWRRKRKTSRRSSRKSWGKTRRWITQSRRSRETSCATPSWNSMVSRPWSTTASDTTIRSCKLVKTKTSGRKVPIARRSSRVLFVGIPGLTRIRIWEICRSLATRTGERAIIRVFWTLLERWLWKRGGREVLGLKKTRFRRRRLLRRRGIGTIVLTQHPIKRNPSWMSNRFSKKNSKKK